MEKKEQYVRQIVAKLYDWRQIARNNPEYYRENTVAVEKFSCELLNLCYDYGLEIADTGKVKIPAVDLIGTNTKTAVRVVGSLATMRIQAIIGRFFENRLNEKYDNLIIFAPMSRGAYRLTSCEQECKENGIHLSVLTMNDIMKRIDMIEDASVLKKITALVERELGITPQDVCVQTSEVSRQEQCTSDSNDTPFVFISYSHADIDRVRGIVEVMLKKEMEIWWDQDIEPGTPWDETIGQHLFDCHCVVALVTKNFMDSTACLDEIYVGKEKDKLLMVYLEDLELPPKMYRYMRIQALRFPTGTKDEEICERLSKTELLKDCYSSH